MRSRCWPRSASGASPSAVVSTGCGRHKNPAAPGSVGGARTTSTEPAMSCPRSPPRVSRPRILVCAGRSHGCASTKTTTGLGRRSSSFRAPPGSGEAIDASSRMGPSGALAAAEPSTENTACLERGSLSSPAPRPDGTGTTPLHGAGFPVTSTSPTLYRRFSHVALGPRHSVGRRAWLRRRHPLVSGRAVRRGLARHASICGMGPDAPHFGRSLHTRPPSPSRLRGIPIDRRRSVFLPAASSVTRDRHDPVDCRASSSRHLSRRHICLHGPIVSTPSIVRGSWRKLYEATGAVAV